MKKINQKAFTLIELLVVIAIIAILVTIVIVAINPVRLINDSRDSKMRSDMQQIKASMQLYYNDCKFYPTSAQFATISGTSWGDLDAANNTCDLNNNYMRQVPKQNASTNFLYSTTSGCTNTGGANCINYVVGANLNNPPTGADTDTTTKCSASATSTTANAGNSKVCND
ncbi:MAG TPA: type II secretion system protein [Candidatus Saccharimonadales bacterium]|nr:type II secretion system protein [Candidatus Saccharimonadales bacterium]